MVLNDASTKQGIYQEIDFLCGSNTTTFPAADKLRLVNHWYDKMQQVILNAVGSYDTTRTQTAQNLTSGTREYTFPTGLLRIKKIEAKMANNFTDWVVVEPLEEDGIDFPIQGESDITERFTNEAPKYIPYEDSFYILSGTIDQTVTNGIVVTYNNDFTNLSADGDIPAVPASFHRILALGPSLAWATKKDAQLLRDSIRKELGREDSRGIWDGLMGELQKHYAMRNKDMRTMIKPKRDDYE